jgi:hypothetical protein
MKTGKITHHLVDDAEFIFCGKNIEWNLIEKTTPNKDTRDDIFDTCSFTHMVYNSENQSRFFELTFLLLEAILGEINEYELEDITQIRINLMTKHVESQNKHTYPHQDDTTDMVLLYYVNDSDGDTHIFTDGVVHMIKPERGKFVLFNNQFHAASFPTEHDTRVVINYNIKLRKRGAINPEN